MDCFATHQHASTISWPFSWVIFLTFNLPVSFVLFTGKSKEAEIKRINKELANIRNKFKGDKTLDGYQKKKYVCKLLFIFLLGHDIDFGHMEAVNLLSSNKYSEKQIVSISTACLLPHTYVNNFSILHRVTYSFQS